MKIVYVVLIVGTLFLLNTGCNLPKDTVTDVVLEDAVDDVIDVQTPVVVNENPPVEMKSSSSEAPMPVFKSQEIEMKKTINPELKKKVK